MVCAPLIPIIRMVIRIIMIIMIGKTGLPEPWSAPTLKNCDGWGGNPLFI
jgi:hypothetical protein